RGKGYRHAGQCRGLLRRRQNRHLGEGGGRPLFQDQGFDQFHRHYAGRQTPIFVVDHDRRTAGLGRNPRLCHLRLERGAGRRQGDRTRGAAVGHPAALRSAESRSIAAGEREGDALRLGDLLSEARLDARQVAQLATIDIAGIAADSRKVKAGFLFFATAGAKADGAHFAKQAAAAGCVAVAAEQRPDGLPATIAFVPVRNARRALALAAAKFFPRQPGTIIGTIGVVSPRGEKYGSLTTPDPVELHRMLDQLAGEGVTHLALEASSHGLDQHRLDGVRIAAGAFTNLSRDHLDYHPTIEAYLAAKLRLFEELVAPEGTAVIDADDCYAGQMVEAAKKRGLKIMTVGVQGDDIKLIGGAIDGFAQVITIAHGGKTYKVKLPLVGAFQLQNAAVAAGLAIATGADPARVFAALE